ncbi:thiamine pyrophosphokinase 1-like isoform X2 [Phalaenopsis equestris]|uniref:thiamine pyrophosphokinase 1-like isoform X2 n=1 Tax=Phalaenopsis equestris TaxID=78828 RepID=UPI0009E398A4|nr:thiamine pyrophosphokinase 1-like isoform X2 [Phalaenopsis equestris]
MEGQTVFLMECRNFFPMRIRGRYKPDVINGDMDSIRAEVKDYYSDLGVEIVDKSHDQGSTDLRKCVTFICGGPSILEKSNLCILVLGALGGRFDHEIGNINVLHRFSNVRIILLSDDCLIFLLSKTHRHEIYIESSVEGSQCGLIPIGAPSARTTTHGLKWDLSETGMHFGGLVSTSNSVREEKITVQSDVDLLWTISLRKPC